MPQEGAESANPQLSKGSEAYNKAVGNDKPSHHEQTTSGDFHNPRHTKSEGKRDQTHDGDNTHSGTGMEYVSRKTHSSHNPGE